MRNMVVRVVGVIAVLALSACDGTEGPRGPEGAAGPQGPEGVEGPEGTAGADWPGPAPAEYVAADGIAGGVAFSKWYITQAGGKGTLAAYDLTVPVEFTRCKACHGWDGLGNAGSYADRTGVSTGTVSRPDVTSVNIRAAIAASSYQQLYDLVARPSGRSLNAADSRHPDFTAHLTNDQIWNILKFMREEWVYPNTLYDLEVSGPAMHYDENGVLVKPTQTYTNIGKDGNAASGASEYAAKCASCHGATGAQILMDGMTVGQFLRAKPHEAWFKIKFGEPPAMAPGIMTDTQAIKDLYKALADDTVFP